MIERTEHPRPGRHRAAETDPQEFSTVIIRMREVLPSPWAQSEFDRRVRAMVPDPANPRSAALRHLSASLDRARRVGSGDLDRGLASLWARQHPAEVEADPRLLLGLIRFGEEAAATWRSIPPRGDALQLPHTVEGLDRWHRRLSVFLRRGFLGAARGDVLLSEEELDRLRVGFDSRLMEWTTARRYAQRADVVLNPEVSILGQDAEIDLVVPAERLIVEIKYMRPFGLATDQWERTRDQIAKRLTFAESLGLDWRVRAEFRPGVTRPVAAALRRMGAEVGGPSLGTPTLEGLER